MACRSTSAAAPPGIFAALASLRFVLAVLQRERLPCCAHLGLSHSCILVHQTHIPYTCRCKYCRRYTSTYTVRQRIWTVPVHTLRWRTGVTLCPTWPRRKRSVVFVYVVVRYSSHTNAQRISRAPTRVCYRGVRMITKFRHASACTPNYRAFPAQI